MVVVVFTLLPETIIVQSFWLDGTIMGEQAGCQEIEKDLLKSIIKVLLIIYLWELKDFSEEQQAVELFRTNKGLMNNYH